MRTRRKIAHLLVGSIVAAGTILGGAGDALADDGPPTNSASYSFYSRYGAEDQDTGATEGDQREPLASTWATRYSSGG